MVFNTKFSLPSFLKQVNRLSDSQRESVKRSGFGNLLHIPNHVLRRSQLIQLMDTWSTEKQSFIFPPGEIKITLLDVSLILGLRVIGKPVVLLEDAPLSSLEKEFGASILNRTISVESLKERLESAGERDDESFIRVFLLYCFGTLLFANAHGKVDSRYLHLLEDVDNLSRFAWGAAILEDLHVCLSQRKRKETNYISGCLILLQIWCYEHVINGRPKLLDGPSTFPRVCRWKSSPKQYLTSSEFAINFEELGHNDILMTLLPTSEEMHIDIIREIPQECHLRTGPGTFEQPIEIQSEKPIRRVRVSREEKEEPRRQDNATIFDISDDEESQVIEDLKREILELKVTVEEQRKENEVMKKVADENKELGKKVQDENKELRREVQDEEQSRKIVVDENKKLWQIVLDETEVLRKTVQEEEEERKKVEDQNGKLTMQLQNEEEVRKRVEDENEELKKLVETLRGNSMLTNRCISNLESILSEYDVDQ